MPPTTAPASLFRANAPGAPSVPAGSHGTLAPDPRRVQSIPPPALVAARAEAGAALASLRHRIDALLAPDVHPRTVLVVDDGADAAEGVAAILRHALSRLPYPVEVRIETDPRAAVAAVADWPATDSPRVPRGVVVVDLLLGSHDVSGLDVLAAVPRHVPVVLVSGAVPDDLPALAERVGADATFARPFDPGEFAATVRELLTRQD